ncbi:MAG: hypothetical protein GX791_00875 [Synergistaceae bacterium]|nr:hypothetical protein [Synergistaceae bacterium]
MNQAAPPIREGIARAPLLFLLSGLAASLAAAGKGIPPVLALVLAPLVSLGLLLLFTEFLPPRFLSYSGGIALLALLCALFTVPSFLFPHLPPENAPSFEGRVILERPWGFRRALLVEGEGRRFMMKVPPSSPVREGDRMKAFGRAVPLSTRRDSSFREDLYWRARAAEGEFLPEKFSVRKGTGWSMARWRSAIRSRMLLTLSPALRGYLLAALLGVRDPSLAEEHRRWGSAHLLAVSGFHVGLAALGAWKLLSLRRIARIFPSRARLLLTSIFLWIYVLLAGAAPSALRAALMIQLVFLGKMLGRPGNPVNGVSAAALFLLLWRPEWFWDVGWRLSVTAALTLAAVNARPSWKTVLLSSPLVWLVTYPQSSAVFGPLPVAGLVVNFAALPVFAVLYPIAFFLALPALVGLPFSNFFSGPAEGLFLLWREVADGAALLLPWSLPWSPLPVLFGGGIFVLLLAGALYPLRARTLAGAAVTLLFVLLILS